MQVDAYIRLNALSPDLVADIERLAPFGNGNSPIILATQDLTLAGYTAVGKHGEHLLVTLEDEYGYTQQAIWWQGADQPIPDHTFDLAFTVRTATYRGQQGIQLEWINSRPSSNASTSLSSQSQIILVHDHRQISNPLEVLASLRSSPQVQIWSEADAAHTISARDRFALIPCDTLVIWSAPPSRSVLSDVLQRANPRQVYLFGNTTTMDQPASFLTRLAGLCKYAINRNVGRLEVAGLAAATNQRLETVSAGLRWLQARGHIKLVEQHSDSVIITSSIPQTPSTLQSPDAELQSLLHESAAYRKYYLREDKDRLINSAVNPHQED
jgi:hypothetical protein